MPIRTLVSFSVDRVEVLDPQGNVDEALMPALTPDQIRALYEQMVFTRHLDERMFKLQRQGRLGTFARVTGQEGAHIGAAMALAADDWMVPAFRELGALLLRGMKPEHLLQFWSGDERGYALPPGSRTLPIAIPVGTHMLHAVGIGWAMKHRGEKAAVLTFFGEGATSEGDFSEAMNMAGVFQVPVVLFCQNNQWAISVPYEKQTASFSVAQKALGYGMTGVQVDGNDVFAVYRVTNEALERARTGGGPTLIEAHTYRVSDHTTSDDARRYRSDEEVEKWRQRDPILRLGLYMRKKGLLDDASEAEMHVKAEERVGAAVAAFEAIPAPGPEEIFRHVYGEITEPLSEQRAALMAHVEGKA